MDLLFCCMHAIQRQYPYIDDKVTQDNRQGTEAPDGTNIDWIDSLRQGAGPRYLQIVAAMERAIGDGRLRVGDRMPPQRLLANILKVDLTTVTRAYEEAKRRHLLKAKGARGTYVAAPKVELAQAIDLSMNIPPPPANIDLRSVMQQGLAQVLMRTDAHELMSYHLGGGSPMDRAAGTIWLKPMLGTLSPNRIIVCPGAQSALAALMLALTRPGDAIACESLVYPGLLSIAEQFNRRLVPIASDAAGMRPDALEEACRRHAIHTIYLNPTLQNPTTLTMPVQRRQDIARTASACKAKIIEDDPYWLLADAPPSPIASLAPTQVYYIATLSKCIAPGLRTAYAVLPDPSEQNRLLPALRSFALMSTPLTMGLITQWIHDSTVTSLLKGVRSEALARQDLAIRMLSAAGHAEHGGIHVWHRLPAHWTSPDLAHAARLEGLAVTACDAFTAGPEQPNAIRISLGGAKNRADLSAALQRLVALLMRAPPPRAVVI